MIFKIEKAKATDVRDIFNLSNDEAVRQSSFNSNQIVWADHVAWFNKKIQSDDCFYFVAKDAFGRFIGQIRFDKFEPNVEQGCWLVSISLCKEFRGMGIGSLLLQQATQDVLRLYNVKKIYAYIKEINQASVKSFSKSGYAVVAKEIIDGVKSFKLMYAPDHRNDTQNKRVDNEH